MPRFLIAALVAFLAAPGMARASTYSYDYNLLLTPTSGTIGGSGSFDVTTTYSPASSLSGVVDITSLAITIGGATFTLADAVGTATATFSSGALTGISYLGDTTSGLDLDILGTGGLSYLYFDFGTDLGSSSGIITAAYAGDATSPTPLPPAAVLFSAGLFILGLLAYRRQSSATAKLQARIA